MQTRPGQGASAAPIFSRRNIMLACLGVIVCLLVLGNSKPQQDVVGVLFAVAFAIGAVCLVFAYAGGIVLALRLRSILLLLLNFVIPPPFGPMIIVFFAGVMKGPRPGSPRP